MEELLDTILLVTEMQELEGEPDVQATGVVLEAHRDPRVGVTATLLIKNGTLKIGDYVVAGAALTPVRAIEDHASKRIQTATFSSPIGVTGFDELPETGLQFTSHKDKKEATSARTLNIAQNKKIDAVLKDVSEGVVCVPLVIKTDVHGTLDAIEHELNKLNSDRLVLKTIISNVGSITEGDIQTAVGAGALVIGFNVRTDPTARDVALQHSIEIHTFDIIYKLAEWLEEKVKGLTPKQDTKETLGEAKLLKIFSETKKGYVLGGKVKSGIFKRGALLHISRRNEHVADGKITNLQSGKQSAEKIEEGAEFGAQIESNAPLEEGDRLLAYEIIRA